MKSIKKLSFLSLSLLGMAFAVSCSRAPQQAPAKTYKTMKVSLSDKSVDNQYTASLEGQQYVEIRPQVGGVITSIKINEGAQVKKGQTLFVIDQVPYRAALETAKANVQSAKAQVETAELNLESRRELFKENVVAEFDVKSAQIALSSAEAMLSQARAQLLSAQNNLSYTEVKSPVSGVASMIPYRVGALVSSSIAEPLVTVSDDQKMYAYFSLTEVQMLEMLREYGTMDSVAASMPNVSLLLADGTAYDQKGVIDAISGTITPSTGAIQLRAVFENPSKILRNGGTGRVVITTERENAIVIPKVATFELQNKIFVYKVVDGKATSQEIQVFANSDGNSYIVESGLSVGDEIIADGAGLVREGTPIDGKAAQAAAAAAQAEQK